MAHATRASVAPSDQRPVLSDDRYLRQHRPQYGGRSGERPIGGRVEQLKASMLTFERSPQALDLAWEVVEWLGSTLRGHRHTRHVQWSLTSDMVILVATQQHPDMPS